MDKGYATLFNATTNAIEQLQTATLELQYIRVELMKAQQKAEEIYMHTSSPEDEVNEKTG